LSETIGKKILIFRPDNIGDVLLFTGALRHIRNLYPDAHITLAVQSHIVNLVELCPYIDICIPIDKLAWMGMIKGSEFPLKYRIEKIINSLGKALKSTNRSFDIIIYPVKSPQVHHLGIIYVLNKKQTFGITGCLLNAPAKGYPPELRPETLFTDYLDISINDPWVQELHVTLAFLRFLGCKGVTLDNIKPQFWLSDFEKNYLDEVKTNDQTIIGLFPGAFSKGRRWAEYNYGELAKRLGGKYTYTIFGSPIDKNLSDRIALSIKERCRTAEILNLTGRTTLRELAKTIASCDLLVSTETSGLHIAIASGIPAVGIVGGGHFGRFVPWGDPGKVLFLTKAMPCFHCNWACDRSDFACIKMVTPTEVSDAANQLLGMRDSV